MIQAKFSIPKMECKKMWCGIYGGHYEGIVFFKQKPVLIEGQESLNGRRCYDLSHDKNANVTAGAMSLDEFNVLYPKINVGHARDTEITELFQIELEGVFDKQGNLLSFGNYHFDGY